MKRIGIGCLVVAGLAVIVLVIGASSVIGVWNGLNAKYQAVLGAKSHYSAALNTCPQKIKGVWTLNSQYLDHESKTFKSVAEARNTLLGAVKGYQDLAKSGAGTAELTKAGRMVEAALDRFQSQATLAVNVQVEAYPALRGAETTQTAMRTMQEGVNEVKTALDDWVYSIRQYNEYRGSAWPSIIGGWMSRFPSRIDYYEGSAKELNVDELNPANKE
jgi:LemA protein